MTLAIKIVLMANAFEMSRLMNGWMTLWRGIGILAIAATIVSGCAGVDDETGEEPAFHADESDLEPVQISSGKGDAVAPRFDPERIVSDAFFLHTGAVDADGVQAFFEDTPYDRRSWLADEVIGARRAADIVVDVAHDYGLNPILLLSRMQVEQGLVGRSERPSQYVVDRAMGCGCHDGQACAERFLGLTNQIICSADTLRRRFDGSVDGTWEWRRGRARTTLDDIRIVPANHSTASLYAYTPWVLEGRGGNWLVWNVTLRYVEHLREFERLDETDTSWVGSPCVSDGDCNFSHDGVLGACFLYGSPEAPEGFCSLPCEGYCPDRAGFSSTFCVSHPDEADRGMCAAAASETNLMCEAIPGTAPLDQVRFVGSSAARASTLSVCMPAPTPVE